MDTETRTYLLEFLIDRFDMSDLRILAFKLGVDYELFNYGNKPDFALELIRYHVRKESLSFLVEKMIEARRDSGLVTIYANLPSCNPVEKLIIASHTKTNRTRDEIARFFGLEPNEISIIAAAKGSSRFLIGLPENALLFLEKIQRKYLSEFSIQRFDTLDSFSQQVWHKAAFEWLPYEEDGKIFPKIEWADIRKQTFLSILDDTHLDSSDSFDAESGMFIPLPVSNLPADEYETQPELQVSNRGEASVFLKSPIPFHANESDFLVWYEVADREEFDSFLPNIQADTVLLVDTRTELYTCAEDDLVIVNPAGAEGNISLVPRQGAGKSLVRFYLGEVEEQFSFKRDPITDEIQFTSEEANIVKIKTNQAEFPIFAENIVGIVIGIWSKLNPAYKNSHNWD